MERTKGLQPVLFCQMCISVGGGCPTFGTVTISTNTGDTTFVSYGLYDPHITKVNLNK